MSERFKNKSSEDILIENFPEEGMNTELHAAGGSFGVIKTMVALKTELIGQRIFHEGVNVFYLLSNNAVFL
ncbi:TPA: hypothetical protein PXJ53_004065 [Yersinia enterocolitica]|uniref:hypothetical protein n=1 Tax=Yersinia enterocolitica TaxID=630 RepID=UPI0005E9CE2C|nr:hypothetical protein [Yersinia enterocolitica]EKN3488401.1 hypothetical protein [Yersinia enterocolitica]EKN3511487.1 hypothetical protein [Yersinia enterocolitica]EKN3515053.1 hypothetical protein [Yersinia enterocolitica]EKN3573017.1 hypothetical protein [Yersinia enterocolitica]EKN3576480.1 hypothetical protein [Yersinia enterocolitica]